MSFMGLPYSAWVTAHQPDSHIEVSACVDDGFLTAASMEACPPAHPSPPLYSGISSAHMIIFKPARITCNWLEGTGECGWNLRFGSRGLATHFGWESMGYHIHGAPASGMSDMQICVCRLHGPRSSAQQDFMRVSTDVFCSLRRCSLSCAVC